MLQRLLLKFLLHKFGKYVDGLVPESFKIGNA